MRSLMFDSGLEAGILPAHHLDFGLRSRQIFGMRFELRMRVGEVQKRHAFAVSTLIRSRRRRRSKSGDQNPGLIADRPIEAAMTSLRVQVLIICPRSPLAGGNLPASRWLLSDGEPLEHLTCQYGLRLVCC